MNVSSNAAEYRRRADWQELFRRHGFHLLIGTFILLISFLYGISAGLKNNNHRAFAALQSMNPKGAIAAAADMDVPSGVEVVPLGNEITINSQPAKMVSFVSNRSISSLVDEQARKWKASGAKVLNFATERRGFVLGLNEQQGERYSMILTSIPPNLRGMLTGGNAVQGYLSILDVNSGTSSNLGNEEVPGVPLMTGGYSGAVFSSIDVGGRSYSAIYSIPSSIEGGMDYYRETLHADGWSEMQNDAHSAGALGFSVGSLIFRRTGEEIVLLFSPVIGRPIAQTKQNGPDAERAMVAVTRGPIQVSSGKMIYER